jgi:hypothetical protein
LCGLPVNGNLATRGADWRAAVWYRLTERARHSGARARARESGISCRKSQLQELFTAHALEHEQSAMLAILLRKEEAYAARRLTIDICPNSSSKSAHAE